MHEARAVLRVPGVHERSIPVLESIADAVQPRAVHHRARQDPGLAHHEAPARDLTDPDTERGGVEPRKGAQDRAEQLPGPARTDEGQVRPRTDELGVVDRVEEERHEVREVVGMKVREQDVADPVPVYSGLDQVM